MDFVVPLHPPLRTACKYFVCKHPSSAHLPASLYPSAEGASAKPQKNVTPQDDEA